MELHIECYSGQKADARPVRFRLGDRDYDDPKRRLDPLYRRRQKHVHRNRARNQACGVRTTTERLRSMDGYRDSWIQQSDLEKVEV